MGGIQELPWAASWEPLILRVGVRLLDATPQILKHPIATRAVKGDVAADP
jgi:hypothetical protein